MKNNTNDNRNATITSNEEYEEALKSLKYYKDEYKWITEVENPKARIKEVNEEALKIIPMLNTESDREQLYYRKYYNTLIRKKYLIESGKYQAYLRKNMLSVFASIMQYKIDSKNYTIISMAKGIIQKDKSLLEDMQNDRMLSRIRIWEGMPSEEDLVLQSPQEILEYIDKHCDLVGIRIPKQAEDKSLLLAISEGYLSKEQKQLIEMLDRFINDEDIENVENSSEIDETYKESKENDAAMELKETHDKDEKTVGKAGVDKERFKGKFGRWNNQDNKQKDEGEISE